MMKPARGKRSGGVVRVPPPLSNPAADARKSTEKNAKNDSKNAKNDPKNTNVSKNDSKNANDSKNDHKNSKNSKHDSSLNPVNSMTQNKQIVMATRGGVAARGASAGRGGGIGRNSLPVPGMNNVSDPSAAAVSAVNSADFEDEERSEEEDMEFVEQRKRKRKSGGGNRSRDSSVETPGKISRQRAPSAAVVATSSRFDALRSASVGSESEVEAPAISAEQGGQQGGAREDVDAAGDESARADAALGRLVAAAQQSASVPPTDAPPQASQQTPTVEEVTATAPAVLDIPPGLVSGVISNIMSQVNAEFLNLSDEDASRCSRYFSIIGGVFNHCSPVLDTAVKHAIVNCVGPLTQEMSKNKENIQICNAKVESLSNVVQNDLKPAIDALAKTSSSNTDMSSLGLLRGEMNRQEKLDKSVKIYGVPQGDDEKCRGDTLKVALDIFDVLKLEGNAKISKEFISDVYRIPSRRQGACPPIRVDFCRTLDRRFVMSAKSQLKATPDSGGVAWKKVRIEDCLTNARSVIFRKLMDHDKVGYVYTRNGDLVVRLKAVDANGAPIEGPFQTAITLRRLDMIAELGIFSDDEISSLLNDAFDIEQASN